MSLTSRRGSRAAARSFAVLASIAMVGGACSADDPGEPAANADAGEESLVLEPLDDGFPSQPITFWNRGSPGHADDVFNILVAEVGQKYSPVPLVTDTNTTGPRIQYELAEFLREQPGWEEGYQVIGQSFTGPTVRPITNEVSCEAGDKYTDLEPLGGMEIGPMAVAVPLDSEFDTLDDFAAWAEQQDEIVTVGGAAGSTGFTVIQMVADEIGVDMRFVPTESPVDAIGILQGGGADIGGVTLSQGIEDQVKVLAVTGDNRTDQFPDAPTTEEIGFEVPIFTVRGYGTFPDEVPEEHKEWLRELLKRVHEDPEFRSARAGFTLEWWDQDQVREYQANYLETTEEIFGDLGLTVEC